MTYQISLETIKEHLAHQFHLPDEQIDKMLPSFVSTLRVHMQNLELALAEEDFQSLGRAGHTIKGAFLNLGLSDCAEIALKIEEKGKLGESSPHFRLLLDDLRLKIEPVLR